MRVNTLLSHVAFAFLLLLLMSGCAMRSSSPVFAQATALQTQPELPDPLRMLDGRPVTSRAQWFKERRPELQALFEHYMYNPIPPRPHHTEITKVGEYHDFLSGKATLKLLT